MLLLASKTNTLSTVINIVTDIHLIPEFSFGMFEPKQVCFDQIKCDPTVTNSTLRMRNMDPGTELC